MSLISRLRQAVDAHRQADHDWRSVSNRNNVSRREMAAVREAYVSARNALNEVIDLVKAEQVLPISSVEEVKFFSRSLPILYERGAVRTLVIRGRGNTRLSEATTLKIRRALLAYGFRAREQIFDLPSVY